MYLIIAYEPDQGRNGKLHSGGMKNSKISNGRNASKKVGNHCSKTLLFERSTNLTNKRDPATLLIRELFFINC